MKLIFLSIAFISFLNGFSQDTIYFDKNWKKTLKSNSFYYRIYSKEGQSIKILDYFNTDTLQMTGYTKSVSQGKSFDIFIKNGIFTYYNENGSMNRQGCYENDKRVGEWKSFHADGELYISEFYDKKGRLEGNFEVYYPDGKVRRSDYYSKGDFKTGKCYAQSGNDTTWFLFKTMPQFPGGEEARIRFLVDNTVYPQQALNEGVQGTVYLSYVVDTVGNIVDLTLLQGISPLLDIEAMRVASIMPKWTPGLQDGKPVRVLFNMPVYFKLD